MPTSEDCPDHPEPALLNTGPYAEIARLRRERDRLRRERDYLFEFAVQGFEEIDENDRERAILIAVWGCKGARDPFPIPDDLKAALAAHDASPFPNHDAPDRSGAMTCDDPDIHT